MYLNYDSYAYYCSFNFTLQIVDDTVYTFRSTLWGVQGELHTWPQKVGVYKFSYMLIKFFQYVKKIMTAENSLVEAVMNS
jgi:hypothetical protein